MDTGYEIDDDLERRLELVIPRLVVSPPLPITVPRAELIYPESVQPLGTKPKTKIELLSKTLYQLRLYTSSAVLFGGTVGETETPYHVLASRTTVSYIALDPQFQSSGIITLPPAGFHDGNDPTRPLEPLTLEISVTSDQGRFEVIDCVPKPAKLAQSTVQYEIFMNTPYAALPSPLEFFPPATSTAAGSSPFAFFVTWTFSPDYRARWTTDQGTQTPLDQTYVRMDGMPTFLSTSGLTMTDPWIPTAFSGDDLPESSFIYIQQWTIQCDETIIERDTKTQSFRLPLNAKRVLLTALVSTAVVRNYELVSPRPNDTFDQILSGTPGTGLFSLEPGTSNSVQFAFKLSDGYANRVTEGIATFTIPASLMYNDASERFLAYDSTVSLVVPVHQL